MDMDCRKRIDGTVIARTLSMPSLLGSHEVVATTMVLMRVPSTSTSTTVLPTTTVASVRLFPSLERSDLL